MTGHDLYRLVEEYVALGPHHRTGTVIDESTRRWFADGLADAGCSVEEHPYEFERYDAKGEVTVNGSPIPSIPLWSRDEGRFATDSPWTGRIEFRPELQRGAAVELAAAKAVGPVGILHSARIAGYPAAIDRPAGRNHGVPIMLTAPFQGSARVEFSATYVPGRSANVLGRKPGAGAPLIIGTGITSWFKAAAERGTGIAIALALARLLPGPLLVVGSTGHELFNHGLDMFLARAQRVEGRAVVLLGGGVAAFGQRAAYTNQPRLDVRRMPLTTDPGAWTGDAAVWATLGVPMITFGGMHPAIRSARDIPGVSTTPELVADCYDIVERAVGSLLESV